MALRQTIELERIVPEKTLTELTLDLPSDAAEKELLIQQCMMFDARELAEAYIAAKFESATDELTGLLSRRAIFRKAERLLARAEHFFLNSDERRRQRQEFSILIVDIDHFKRVNDKFGHPAGDRIIQYVAEAVRPTDIAGRYGGEEFAILLPETGKEGALKAAENFLNKVQTTVKTSDGAGVTVSIGVASAGPDYSLETLVKRADLALYMAKNEGRNRVRFAEA